MKAKQSKGNKQPWHRKPSFGSLYTTKGSRYIYISINYFKVRLRFPTDKEDCAKNWDELCDFLEKVGQKIKNRTFVFAKAFYWLDEKTKAYFTVLEGNDYKPEPEHVFFGDYAEKWIDRKIPNIPSITKKRYYLGALTSRILPYFKKTSFSNITSELVESFIDNLKRQDGSDKALSTKRINNIIGPLRKVWEAACNDNNWNLRNPFMGITTKLAEIKDKELQEIERQIVDVIDGDKDVSSCRDVFLLAEWKKLRNIIDPHYHLVIELLLMGVIGSELEALQKRDIKDNTIIIRRTLVRDKGGKLYLKFKPKNWYRKRELHLTARMKELVGRTMDSSSSEATISFENCEPILANTFLFTMKDGRPFNYDSFSKTVWNKAMNESGIDRRVPYASRHTLVQWSLLIGIAKTRLVDIMGHCNKKMVDNVYGSYKNGLVEERQEILDYLGEDFLALEELRIYFPDRYKKAIRAETSGDEKTKAPVIDLNFCQSFGQSQRLYPDNYL